jgi:hypothetical protein
MTCYEIWGFHSGADEHSILLRYDVSILEQVYAWTTPKIELPHNICETGISIIVNMAVITC